MVTFWAVSGPKLGGVVNLGNETQKISSTATIRNHIWWLSHAENILEIGRPPSFGPARFSRTTTLKEYGISIQPRPISGTSSCSISSCENEPSNVVERREDLRHHKASVTQVTSPVKKQPISLSEINNRCERAKWNLFKTEEEIVKIESQTRQPSASQEAMKR